MTAPSDPRRDIEKFLAMGGGSFDLLLDMVGGAQPPETAPQTLGWPTRLPVGYRLEHDPDVSSLLRADGSFVAVFSARGVTEKAVMRAIEEDRRGLPAYFGWEERAGSARRLVETGPSTRGRVSCGRSDIPLVRHALTPLCRLDRTERPKPL